MDSETIQNTDKLWGSQSQLDNEPPPSPSASSSTTILAATVSTTTLPYTPIQPRGDPNVHRQAMAVEQELHDNQLIIERRRRNTQAAARMRERQRKREQELTQRRNDLMVKVEQLEFELAQVREQRQASQADGEHDYDDVLSKLAKELEVANDTMHKVIDEVENLVKVVRSLDPNH